MLDKKKKKKRIRKTETVLVTEPGKTHYIFWKKEVF